MRNIPGTVCLMSAMFILCGCMNQEAGSVNETIQENNERIGTTAETNSEITVGTSVCHIVLKNPMSSDGTPFTALGSSVKISSYPSADHSYGNRWNSLAPIS